MSALNRLPDRQRLRAVLMRRDGLGFRIGVGPIATGEIEGKASGVLSERDAEREALALADSLDLLAVRS